MRIRGGVVPLFLAIAGCASPRAPAADVFFTLPILAEGETPGTAPTETVPGKGEVRGYEVQLSFTRAGTGELLQAPKLLLHEQERAFLHVGEEVSFVQDFDVRSEGGAFLADPIIGVLQTGLLLEITPHPTRDPRRVALLFSVVHSDLPKQIPVREIVIGRGTPGRIQLPATVVTRISGSSVVSAGVGTFIGHLPSPGGELDVGVRVIPVALPENTERTGGEIRPQAADRPAAEMEPTKEERSRREALERQLRVDGAPRTRGWFRISLVRLDAGESLDRPIHLERAEAKRRLSAVRRRTMKTFLLPADSVPGTEAKILLQRSYVRDYVVQSGNSTIIEDVLIGTFRVGFEGTLGEEDGERILRYSWSSLHGMDSFTTLIVKEEVTIDVPEITKVTGKLALRADANLAPVAQLEDGGTIALLVERVVQA